MNKKPKKKSNKDRLIKFPQRPAAKLKPHRPALRFSPLAWAKLLLLRDLGDTEVGGFGISDPQDLLYVQDVELVGQTCTLASVVFDDDSVADFFDRQIDAGRHPQEFARLWAHTHPGDCAQPSQTDEETFARVFGKSDWAVMFILAQGGQTYARLSFHVGPQGALEIPVQVDYSKPFEASRQDQWEEQYLQHVHGEPLQKICRPSLNADDVDELLDDDWLEPWYDGSDLFPRQDNERLSHAG